MAELPRDTPWLARPDLARLVDALGPGNLRWVGGAVRDTLLGVPVSDVDGATPLRPDTVMERLTAAGIKVVPTGIEHGTVTAVQAEGTVEITTLRHDIATDGRHATVAFATDWREDAARRDFTINALYADPDTLAIFDYFGGLDDLAAARVRFIGDAHQRIAEDHLRILRYYRFQARFGATLDAVAEEACAALAPTLKGLSRERIGGELTRLLALPDPADTVARMAERGVLPIILPDAEADGPARLQELIARENAAQIDPAPLRRLGALLPADPAVTESVAARLRLSKADRARLTCLAARETTDADAPRALAYRVGPLCAIDRLLLLGGDPASVRDWEPPRLPLKGGEIVARGIGAGPQVAAVLRAIEARWIAEGFPGPKRVDVLLTEELARIRDA